MRLHHQLEETSHRHAHPKDFAIRPAQPSLTLPEKDMSHFLILDVLLSSDVHTHG